MYLIGNEEYIEIVDNIQSKVSTYGAVKDVHV